MEGKKIRVFIKNPGEAPYVAHIANTLKNLQKYMNGSIETETFDDCVVICNEEGLINGSKYNCTFRGLMFFGTIIFAGTEEDDFGDIGYLLEEFKNKYGELFR